MRKNSPKSRNSVKISKKEKLLAEWGRQVLNQLHSTKNRGTQMGWHWHHPPIGMARTEVSEDSDYIQADQQSKGKRKHLYLTSFNHMAFGDCLCHGREVTPSPDLHRCLDLAAISRSALLASLRHCGTGTWLVGPLPCLARCVIPHGIPRLL